MARAAPYGRAFRKGAPPKRAVRGLADVLATVREVRGIPVLVAMILLAGGASFFVGNSYQAQMPAFAADLGHGNPGTAYSVLLAADAAGALIAGVLLETRGGFFETKATSAIVARDVLERRALRLRVRAHVSDRRRVPLLRGLLRAVVRAA